VFCNRQVRRARSHPASTTYLVFPRTLVVTGHQEMRPFEPPSRAGAQWFSAGLSSSFPDLDSDDDDNLSELRICNGDLTPGCKVFQVPQQACSAMSQLAVAPDAQDLIDAGGDLKDQVLIFQYKGKFHAIDHVSKTYQRLIMP